MLQTTGRRKLNEEIMRKVSMGKEKKRQFIPENPVRLRGKKEAFVVIPHQSSLISVLKVDIWAENLLPLMTYTGMMQSELTYNWFLFYRPSSR